MSKGEKIITGSISGILFLCCPFYLFYESTNILHVNSMGMTLTGLTAGVILCLVWLPGVLRKLYTIHLGFFMVCYGIAAGSLYLFVFRVPFPILLITILGGTYVGRRAFWNKMGQEEYLKLVNRTSLFTCMVMLVFMLVTVLLIILGVGYPDRMYSTISQSYGVNPALLWLFILGFFTLVMAVNYFIVLVTARYAYRNFHNNDGYL